MKPEIETKWEKNVRMDPGRGLCEYELIRLENIRQREAMFAELNLDAAKVEALPRIERARDAPFKQPERKEKVVMVIPARASSRLAYGSVKEIVREIVQEIVNEIGRYDSESEPEVPRALETDEGTKFF